MSRGAGGGGGEINIFCNAKQKKKAESGYTWKGVRDIKLLDNGLIAYEAFRGK